jgi:signal-transduction protein with cAMP-binding, CBS, and nucleotidyltransferase domain
MKVSDVLKAKGAAVRTVRSFETVQAVAKQLRQERVAALVVSDDCVTLDGIFTERDLSHGIAVHGARVLSLPVSDLMRTKVVTCNPEDGIADIGRVMTVCRLRHLPVKQGAQLVGIVSIGDVMKYLYASTTLFGSSTARQKTVRAFTAPVTSVK